MSDLPPWLSRARNQWRWRGLERPDFAPSPREGQESVWDYPRPPVLATDLREVVVLWGGVEIARSKRTIRVMETSHPPTFYIPLNDVRTGYLRDAGGGSFCEWKGQARYFDLVDGARRLERVGWGYPAPLEGAEVLRDAIAFYAQSLDCKVGGAAVTSQPGGFYGGWITAELTGPFKGSAGSEAW
jgi:uncharacterized protein (DUF427 family)